LEFNSEELCNHSSLTFTGSNLQLSMRILLSAYACRPNAGSEPGFGWNWATHLAARGIEVHTLVAKRNQSAVEAGLELNPSPTLHFHYVAVPWERAKRYEPLHYALWQRAALKAARELSAKFDFQLAHHVTYGSVHVPSELWRLGIPVVFGPIGGGQTAPASMLRYFGADRLKEQARSLLTRALPLLPVHARRLRRMSVIWAANRDTLNLVRAIGCSNAKLMCDTAIPADYFSPGPRIFNNNNDALRLLWVGRMLTRKALPLALDALQAARASATLTIAGDGLDSGTVHRMIAERNLQSRVFWKGSRLTFAELRSAYAEHDALLFTSLRDSFGSQLLEAMAMGLSIITLDLHGAHDFVPRAASLKVRVGRPAETVRALADAINHYAFMPAMMRDEMSKQAWMFAKTLSWPQRAEYAEQLYEKLLSRVSPARATTSHSKQLPVPL
jgi:glycosyltransferase involved in cell wall biosynthesis